MTSARTQEALLGVRRNWRPEDLEEVTSHSRDIWKSLKRRNGWESVRDIPGFTDSLQSLYDQGYSITDIGAFFGVTRERVRQWCNDFGIKRDNIHGSMVRVWSDELNRFTVVPISRFREMVKQAHVEQVRQGKVSRIHSVAIDAYRDVELVRYLAETLGRSPYRVEILEAMGYRTRERQAAGHIAVSYRWGRDNYRPERCSYKKAWANLFRCAGRVQILGTGKTKKARAIITRTKHSAETVLEARALRAHGMRYRKIAETLLLTSDGTAWNLVNRYKHIRAEGSAE